ncbi:MAG: histidine kinase [Chitinophagaceae bacterium]
MIRVFALCLLFVSCKQPKSGLLQNGGRADSIVNQIGNRVNKYLIMENMDSLGYFLDSIKPTIQNYNDERVTLSWILQKAQQVKIQGKNDSLRYYMKLASNVANSGKIKGTHLLNFYSIYGNLLIGQNLRDSALSIGITAYHLSIKLDSFRYAETCQDLAQMYANLDDLPNCRKYLFEAWKNRAKDPDQIPFIAGTMAAYYDATEQVDSALYFLKEFDKDTALINRSELHAWGYENAAYFFTKKGDFGKALENVLKAKTIYDQSQNKDISILFSIAEVYGSLHQYDSSLAYLDSARLLALKKQIYPLVKESWKEKGKQYFIRNLFRQAYTALDSAYASYEIEMDSSLRKHGRELETQYSVREKDKEIKSLAVTNAASLKIRRQQKIIILSLIISAILASFIGILLWKRSQIQTKVREADLRQQLLRAQMEPHFLFNMLSVLQALIRSNDTEKSVLLLNKFSRLLRSILENARKKFVPLSEEISVLESYLTLQTMLLENKFEYIIEVDGALQQDAVLVPPMLLQPFAENAIQHGFQGIQYKGVLVIQIKRGFGSLICIIDDNGRGIHQPSVKDGRAHASDITRERLLILSKQIRSRAKLRIIDKITLNEGQGVRVEIEIPFVK